MDELLGKTEENTFISEYGDMGAINEAFRQAEQSIEGLGGLGDLGVVKRILAPVRRITNQVANQNRTLRQSSGNPDRQAFEARVNMFPESIRQGLRNKQLQAVEAYYYVCKCIEGSKSVDMFTDNDKKIEGTGSITGGRLDVGCHMILTGISLLRGIKVAGQTEGEIVYDIIPSHIRNGEVEMNANTGSFVLPKISCEIFDTSDMTNTRKGLYLLKNPKYLKPEEVLAMLLKLPIVGQAGEYLKLGLIGVATHKY